MNRALTSMTTAEFMYNVFPQNSAGNQEDEQSRIIIGVLRKNWEDKQVYFLRVVVEMDAENIENKALQGILHMTFTSRFKLCLYCEGMLQDLHLYFH